MPNFRQSSTLSRSISQTFPPLRRHESCLWVPFPIYARVLRAFVPIGQSLCNRNAIAQTHLFDLVAGLTF